MAREASTGTTVVPCSGCGANVIVPAGPVRAALRNRERYVMFCSRKCNRVYVAKEGLKQQVKKRDS